MSRMFCVVILAIMWLVFCGQTSAQYQFTGPNGNVYEYVLAPQIPWDEANEIAQQSLFDNKQGHLATITSFEEDEFLEIKRQEVATQAGYSGTDIQEFWVGGYQLPDQATPQDGWMWVNDEGEIPGVNGTEIYANWIHWTPDSYEPNDCCDKENYLGIGLVNNFGWNDEGALGFILGYIIEYDIPHPNQPPQIIHTPITIIEKGKEILFSFDVTDDQNQIQSIAIYTRLVGIQEYLATPVAPNNQGTHYDVGILGLTDTLAGVEYYIEAKDTKGLFGTSGTAQNPHQIETADVLMGFNVNVDGYGFDNDESILPDNFQEQMEGIVNSSLGRELVNPLMVPIKAILIVLLQNGGYCYGMSSTAILYYRNLLTMPVGFQQVIDVPWEKAKENVQKYHEYQIDNLVSTIIRRYFYDAKKEFGEIKKDIDAGDPSQVNLYGAVGHSIVAIGYGKIDDDHYKLLVYDVNFKKQVRSLAFDFLENKVDYQSGKWTFDKAIHVTPKTNASDIPAIQIKKAQQSLVEISGITGRSQIFLKCPVNIVAIDDLSRKIGIDDFGQIFFEIPEAGFEYSESAKILYLPDGPTYTINLFGCGESQAELGIISGNQGFVYDDFDVSTDFISQIIYSSDKTELPMAVDEDGNGIHDHEIQPQTIPFTTDSDGDGVLDYLDNCPENSNPDQADENSNWIGDACEILFIRCDSNRDGNVDISDAINTLGHLFIGTGEVTCEDAADANDDGEIDISDAITTLTFLFIGGEIIPPPYPILGVDLTPDNLTCEK